MFRPYLSTRLPLLPERLDKRRVGVPRDDINNSTKYCIDSANKNPHYQKNEKKPPNTVLIVQCANPAEYSLGWHFGEEVEASNIGCPDGRKGI